MAYEPVLSDVVDDETVADLTVSYGETRHPCKTVAAPLPVHVEPGTDDAADAIDSVEQELTENDDITLIEQHDDGFDYRHETPDRNYHVMARYTPRDSERTADPVTSQESRQKLPRYPDCCGPFGH